jgi:hypothetical protein
MRFEWVTDPAERERLHSARAASATLRCDPGQDTGPPIEDLLAAERVAAVYDGDRPLIYSPVRPSGCPSWLSIVEPNAEAAVELARGIYRDVGSCHGTIANPEVRALFAHPEIWHDGEAYFEWRPPTR